MPALTNEFLPKTMQAVICHGPEDYRLEEWDVPTPGPGEVVIRVEAVGICASDLKCYLGAAALLGRRAPQGLLPAAGHPRARVRRRGGRARRRRRREVRPRASATAPSPSRSFPAGSAASASAASTGCARSTTSTASASAPSAPWPSTCSSRAARSTTRCRPPSRSSMPRSSSRSPAPSMPSSAATSSSRTPSSSPAPGRSASAWSPRPALKNPRLLIAVDLSDQRLETAKACGADLGLNPEQGRRGRRGAEAHRRLRLRRLHRGDRPSRGGRERASHDPQARHLRRVQRHARAGDRRLDDHRRHQGAQHPRLASRPVLLSGRDQDARGAPAAHGSDRHPQSAACRRSRRASISSARARNRSR